MDRIYPFSLSPYFTSQQLAGASPGRCVILRILFHRGSERSLHHFFVEKGDRRFVRCDGGNLLKGLLDIVARFSRRFIKYHGAIPCTLLSIFRFDAALLFHILLVSQQEEGEAFAIIDLALFFKLLLPIMNRRERALIRYVVHQYAGIGAAIKGVAQRLEPLLSGSVPNLEGDGLVFERKLFGVEVRANGGFVLLLELIRYIPLQQCGLSDSRLADNNDLYEHLLGT